MHFLYKVISNIQSKIDSLKELNSKLLAEISELRKENAEINAENTKLKQAMEANAELRDRVTKLEQKQTQSDSIHVLKDSILHKASSDSSSNIHTYSSSLNRRKIKRLMSFWILKVRKELVAR